MTINKSKLSLTLFFMKGSVHLFLLSMISTLAVSLSEMITPKLITLTVDSIIEDKPIDASAAAGKLAIRLGGAEYLREHMWIMAVAIIIMALIMGVFKYLAGYFGTAASETLTERTRNSLYFKIERLPFSWHTENPSGDIIQRCTSDVETLKNFLSEQLTSIVSTVLMIALSLAFLFGISGTIAMIALLSIPVIFSFSFLFHRLIRRRFAECDENEGVLSSVVQENLTGVRVVRAFGREAHEIDKFTRQNVKYTNCWVKLCRIMSGFWAVGDLIGCVQVMLVILAGIYLCIGDKITTGEFIAAITYNSMLLWPVRRLGRMVSELSKADIAIGRISYIMNAPEETDAENACPADGTGDVEFNRVSFSFDGKNNVLSDVSFKIKSGETVGILGGTGSGKSTLMQLLCRLHDLKENQGSITLSGVDIRRLTARSLRQAVGIVLQEPFLFSRSIAENISMARIEGQEIRGASDIDSDMRKASEIACLEDAVNGFVHGYDTVVGERGVTLSGGQKQRVAIARILLRGAPILIFDDSLSAVDAETDAKIRRAIRRELKGSTVIIISHRISSIMHADDIIVLDQGKIVERGNHSELINKNGTYKRIYDLQSADASESAEKTEMEVRI